VPLDGLDLMAPVGALTPELLLPLRTVVPNYSDSTTAVQVAYVYADAGIDQTATWTDADRADRGAAAWATYRALMDRAQQILTAAASLSADDVSRSYSSAQAVELQKRAAEFLAAYEAEAAAETGATATFVAPVGSRTVRNAFAW
jgi:hypothetical protein